MSGRFTRLAPKAPQTKPICTPLVSHERMNGERFHSRLSSGRIEVAEIHAVSDRTIAIDSNRRTSQRGASAARCSDRDSPAVSVVDMVAQDFCSGTVYTVAVPLRH